MKQVIKIIHEGNADVEKIAEAIRDLLKTKFAGSRAKVEDQMYYGIRITLK